VKELLQTGAYVCCCSRSRAVAPCLPLQELRTPSNPYLCMLMRICVTMHACAKPFSGVAFWSRPLSSSWRAGMLQWLRCLCLSSLCRSLFFFALGLYFLFQVVLLIKPEGTYSQ
jgi:hypothetical protein